MTTTSRPGDRDDILFAFHQECAVPTAEQIIDWCERYPQFANDIRDDAAISRDLAARSKKDKVSVSESMLNRGFSRVLNLLFEADNAPAQAADPKPQSFKEAATKCGVDVPKLASKLDIDRAVLAALFNGRMLAPAGKRLVTAVTQALQLPLSAFATLHREALANPRFGLAKSSETPSVKPETYEVIVQNSAMTDERKRFWMGED
jgi:hypothetical protein